MTAITLGRIQCEFQALYGSKEMIKRLNDADRTKELLRICSREGVSYESFNYLEKYLITGKVITS
jgi:hypothetical protein|tara:strand:+ start:252 stop:446 length:195 start_codon:yes stop_codon:yes gene_type:complete